MINQFHAIATIAAIARTGAIILWAAILCSCATGRVKKPETQALYGMIYDRDNRPVSNVSLYVNNKYMVASDIQGHFAIPSMRTKEKYTISARKEHYEPVTVEIAYADPSYVLYLRVFSADQLLAEAEGAIRERDWNRAESLLERGRKTGGDESSIQFLRGILLWYQEQYQDALKVLITLGEKEKAPPIYLFIADLYQYYLNDPSQAAAYLERYLRLQHDPETRKRYEELGEEGGMRKEQ